jgi:predicted DNA-binding transcriptional regulator AlpA
MEPTSRSPGPAATSLWTPQIVCKLLAISRRTLRHWIAKKVFPEPMRIGPDGRVLRWHPADVIDYLQYTRGRVATEKALREVPET